jgi:aspartyl-tRNA(Asn)/glutamyl-tRNA(Gln) amidotransferase subunit C
MKITRQEVEHVAMLARLELGPDELGRITGQLDTILSYVAKLDELDTEGVAVTTHTQDIANAFRDDEVRDSLDRSEALANGPCQNGEAFMVPRVIS